MASPGVFTFKKLKSRLAINLVLEALLQVLQIISAEALQMLQNNLSIPNLDDSLDVFDLEQSTPLSSVLRISESSKKIRKFEKN